MKEDGAHSGHSRAAGLALVDVRGARVGPARDSGEPVKRGRTDCAGYFKKVFSYVGGRTAVFGW